VSDRQKPRDPWDAVGFAGNEADQLLRGLSATPAQRLAWLEAALELAYRSGALRPLTAEGAEGRPDGETEVPDQPDDPGRSR